MSSDGHSPSLQHHEAARFSNPLLQNSELIEDPRACASLLQEALQKKFPSARFSIVPANAQIQDDKVMDSIVEMEYDAVIVGNAA